MKKRFIYVFVLWFVFPSLVEGESSKRLGLFFDSIKAFDPMAAKEQNCRDLEEIKSDLSCQGQENCNAKVFFVGKPSFISLLFQGVTSVACSFECVIGQELCNETLNPDPDKNPLFGTIEYDHHDSLEQAMESSCDYSTRSVMSVEEQTDEKGDTYKIRHILYDDLHGGTCEEWTEHLVLCDEDGKCDEVLKYSDEWQAHQKQQARKTYRESCFIATAEDCSHIASERSQCLRDVVKIMKRGFCETDTLWLYREWREEIMEEISQ